MADGTMAGRPVVIYGLIDPKYPEIRYVGKTVCPLAHRLHGHVKEAFQGTKMHSRKARWIRYLIANGRRPEIVVIEVVPSTESWAMRERHWIAHHRAAAPGLNLNWTAGGDGLTGFDAGRTLSAEVRAKISEKLKGRQKSAATIERMRKAQKGRTFTDEQRARIAETLRRRAQDPAHRQTFLDLARLGNKTRHCKPRPASS